MQGSRKTRELLLAEEEIEGQLTSENQWKINCEKDTSCPGSIKAYR